MYLKYLSHRWELKKSHHNIVTPPSPLPRHWISSEVVSVWDFSTGSTVIQWLVTWFELGRCCLGLSQSKWAIWLVISTQLVKWENTTRRQKENENMLTRRSNILVNLILCLVLSNQGKMINVDFTTSMFGKEILSFPWGYVCGCHRRLSWVDKVTSVS